jgi:Uri superfamily endonuclease
VPGYYVYVGSALGPGGVRARVLRHCRTNKSEHWHIDYLPMSPVAAWYRHTTECLEHRWAELFSSVMGLSSIPGFGCSDCRCESHLFVAHREPDFAAFAAAAGNVVRSRRAVSGGRFRDAIDQTFHREKQGAKQPAALHQTRVTAK